MFCVGDVLALHILLGQLRIGVQQLEGCGQVVIHELLELRFLCGILLSQCKDSGADLLQPGDLCRHHRVGDGIVGPAKLLQQSGVRILRLFGCGRGRLRGGRNRCGAPHHQCVRAVVDIGVRAEITVVNGAFQHRTAPGRIDARRCEQLGQGNVVPLPHNFIQMTLQLAGAVHVSTHQQCAAAAHCLGQSAEQTAPLRAKINPQADDISQICEAHQQKKCAACRTQTGQRLLPLFGALLLLGGTIMTVLGFFRLPDRRRFPGLCGTEIRRVIPLCPRRSLLFALNFPVDALEDPQNNTHPGRHGKQNKQRNGGNAGKIMLACWLHSLIQPPSSAVPAYGTDCDDFLFIITESSAFVKR